MRRVAVLVVALALTLAVASPASAAPLVTITGTVTVADGTPLSGLTVGVGTQGYARNWTGTTTNARGQYRLRTHQGVLFLSFGNSWDAGYAPAIKSGFRTSPGSTYTVNRTLQRSATISGTVRPGIAVVLYSPTDFREISATGYSGGFTDASGAFSLTTRAGDYRVRFVEIRTQATAWLGNAGDVSASPTVSVSAGGVASGIDQTDASFTGERYIAGLSGVPLVTLTSAPVRPRASITDTIRNSAGAPLVGYEYANWPPLGQPTERLDADMATTRGRIALTVRPGRVAVIVDGPHTSNGLVLTQHIFTAASNASYRFDTTLSLASQIAGTVRTRQGETPTTDKSAHVAAFDANTRQIVSKSPVNGKGTYHLTLPAGSYRLKFIYDDSAQGEWFAASTSFASTPIVSVVEGGKVAGVNATVAPRK